MTKHEFEIQQLKDQIEYHQGNVRFYSLRGNTQIVQSESRVIRACEKRLAELQEKMKQ